MTFECNGDGTMAGATNVSFLYFLALFTNRMML